MKTLLASALLCLAAPAFAADATPIETAIASPERTDKDRERDAREKPAEVLAFAGVKPGMTVVDMFAGGGYYTELLAGVVGPNGKVLSVNNVPYEQYSKDAVKARFTEGRLKNVERRLVEASYMNLPPKSVDLIVIVHVLSRRVLDRREGRLAGYQHRRLHRVAEAHAEARRQTTDRRPQRARRHRPPRWRARRIASTRTSRRRA